jgi:hypothetical protein
MQRILTLVVLLVIGTGCTRPKQITQCMVDADRIISEVQEHRAVFGAAGQYATPVGQRRTVDLLDRDGKMISCIASDPANRQHYREALDMDDTVKSDRFLQYLLDTRQMQDFGQWEQQQQTAAVGHN